MASTLTTADHISYVVLGTTDIILNSLIFVVLISDRSLLNRSAFPAGIALGNFLLGLFQLIAGSYRIANPPEIQLQPTTILSCVRNVFPLIYPLAFNVEACFLLLAGLERFLAVSTPVWFRSNWTNRVGWKLAGMACGAVLIIELISLVAPAADRVPVTWQCTLNALYGLNYVRFLSSFSALAGAVSAMLTVTTLISCIRRLRRLPISSNEFGQIRKQYKLTRSMVMITCADVGLMVIPNLMSLLGNLHVPLPSFIRPSNSSYTNSVASMVAFFAFVAFNNHFRTATVKLLRLHKLPTLFGKSQMKVAPVQPTAVQNLVTPGKVIGRRRMAVVHGTPGTL